MGSEDHSPVKQSSMAHRLPVTRPSLTAAGVTTLVMAARPSSMIHRLRTPQPLSLLGAYNTLQAVRLCLTMLRLLATQSLWLVDSARFILMVLRRAAPRGWNSMVPWISAATDRV